jgi:hypothetical protein
MGDSEYPKILAKKERQASGGANGDFPPNYSVDILSVYEKSASWFVSRALFLFLRDGILKW